MAVGPIRLAMAAGLRSAMPVAYVGPLNDNLAGWIADPGNTWVVISFVVAALMLGSGLWLWFGAVTFSKKSPITFIGALALFLGVFVLLWEGGKIDPFDYHHLFQAALFLLAYLATGGYLLTKLGDEEGDDKDKKDRKRRR